MKFNYKKGLSTADFIFYVCGNCQRLESKENENGIINSVINKIEIMYV